MRTSVRTFEETQYQAIVDIHATGQVEFPVSRRRAKHHPLEASQIFISGKSQICAQLLDQRGFTYRDRNVSFTIVVGLGFGSQKQLPDG